MSPEEIARSHRWHAIECNNLAWALSCEPSRTADQEAEMLNAAHASAYHWAKVGTELNQVRAKMLLAQVYAALGLGQPAQDYAQESYDYLIAHDPPDWELAFAYAILAHAAYAAGDAHLHRQHHRKARELGQSIADPEDKEIFFKTFNAIPGP
jgi:hypothetical protein